jgi:hypothetical protein
MQDHEEHFDCGGSGRQARRPWHRRAASYRRCGGLVVLAAAAAIVLTACGGGSAAPHVANLGQSSATSGQSTASDSGGSTTTTQHGGTPTQILDEWASCMRAHGDPNQADPTIDANGIIHITWNPAIPGGYEGTNQGGQGNLGPGQYCRQYLSEAQTALEAGQSIPTASQAQLVKFAQCMRSNGIPDYPDPVSGNLSINLGASGDLNPDNPTFQNATKVCAQKTGVHVPGSGGGAPSGTIELNGATPPGASGTGSDG